eukprot:COSAG06_NODE_65639_length_256_cov_0.987261_1_plen_34_part_01
MTGQIVHHHSAVETATARLKLFFALRCSNAADLK